MRLVCPACDASYEVPEHKLSGRKSVRCARCGDSWVPEILARLAPEEPPPIPAPEPVPESAPGPAPEPAPDLAAESPELVPDANLPPDAALAKAPLPPEWQPPVSPALPIAWGISIAAVLCGIAVLLLDHAAIAAAWPPMQRLYGLIRLS